MSKNDIKHEGKVVAIEPDFVSVEFVNKSACSSCHAKRVCMASDESIKVVEVPNSVYLMNLEVGDTVNILLKQTMGFKAVWISYVIPLVILVVLLLSLSDIFRNELIVGLISLGAVGLYYFIIYLIKDKIAKDFVFTIEKID